MGIFSGITDHFKNSEFSVAPNKKLKTLSKDFKAAFNLSLVFYKGHIIAEDNLTLAALNKKTSKDVDSSSKVDLKIKASMKVGDVEDLFEVSLINDTKEGVYNAAKCYWCKDILLLPIMGLMDFGHDGRTAHQILENFQKRI